MQIVEGTLIPGVGIGEYSIGMKKKDLLKKLGHDCINEYLGDGEHKIILENAMIWIDKNDLVYQIGVTKGFQSAYQDKIQIGTTLNEIQDIYGGYEDRYGTYNLIGVDGFCFEMEDVDEFEYLDNSDILKSPIEWMFVYQIPDRLVTHMPEIQGEIIPGVSIGAYYIGMEKKELIKKLGILYIDRYQRNGKHEIIIKNAKIELDENNFVKQIGVTKGFQGDYQDKIRIGMTLNEVQKIYGDCEEAGGIYRLKGAAGLSFELENDGSMADDSRDIEQQRIEWIYVYRLPEGQKPVMQVTKITEGKVIPCESIGDYYIGMKKTALRKMLGDSSRECPQEDGKCKICLENAVIWIDSEDLVERIGVSRGFQGAYQHYLKIGTTLEEVKAVFWEYEEENGVFHLSGVDGLSFTLNGSRNIQDKGKQQIEWIYVYKK